MRQRRRSSGRRFASSSPTTSTTRGSGGAHPASAFVGPDTRRELGPGSRRFLEAAARPWIRVLPGKIAGGCVTHGVPSDETTRAVVRETLNAVVLPGFESLGVPIAAGREWCASALPQ